MIVDQPSAMRTSFLALLFLSAFASMAQGQFPTLAGETADGTSVTLPVAKGKKYTIVGMAYGQKAQPLLEAWYEPAYLRFVRGHGLFAGQYDAAVYFVPLFVGVNKSAYEPSIKKFRKTATPEVVDLVIFAKAEADMLRTQLGMTDKDIPYIFVLDATGRIVFRTQGAFTDEKLEAIEEVLLQ